MVYRLKYERKMSFSNMGDSSIRRHEFLSFIYLFIFIFYDISLI